MKDQIKTSIQLPYSREQVWKVLMDFEKYPEWNPFITSIQGEQKKAGKLRVNIQPPGNKGMVFKPELINFQENYLFEWKGKLLVSGLFDGTHRFQLEGKNETTLFKHEEQFEGFLVPLLRKTLESTKLGFEAMNQALLKRCQELYK